MSWRSSAVVLVVIAVAIGAWVLFAHRSPPSVLKPAAPANRDSPRSDEPPPAAPASRAVLQPIRPRAVADDEPASAPVEQSPCLTVTVVDGEGRPVPGANVSSCPTASAFQFPDFETTDQEGRAALILIVHPDDTHIVVTAAGYAPVLAPITNRESMRVVLGGEVTLRGRVLVEGAPPGKVMRLTLRGFDDRTESWPQPARELIAYNGFGETRLPFDTDSSGAFAVRGPARGAQVTLEIPEGYRFLGSAEDSEQREVAAVCDGTPVLVDVVARTAITGRIVSVPAGATSTYESPTGRPLDIEIRYVLQRPSPHGALSGSRHTNVGDQFSLYFTGVLESADIEVWRRQRLLGAHRVRERIATSKDLGDIEIGAPANATFRITDPAGNPIGKARVVARGHVSEPTDSEGRTTLGVVAGTRSVVAGAPGFRVMDFALPDPLPDPVELRLELSVTLVVRVRPADPTVLLTGLDVALAYDSDLARSEAASFEFHDVRISSPSGMGWNAKRITGYYSVHPGQDLLVSGFKAGDELEVRVEDKHHHVLESKKITLRDAETHPVEMVVKWKPQTVRGTILAEMGQAIVGAKPRVVGNWIGSWGMPGTDASGRFEIGEVYGSDVQLTVSAPGYVEKTVAVEDPSEPVIVRLERARPLSVALTGAEAASFQGTVTFDIEGGETFTAQRRSERQFWFEAIPRRPGTIRASAAPDRATSTPISAADTSVAVRIPE